MKNLGIEFNLIIGLVFVQRSIIMAKSIRSNCFTSLPSSYWQNERERERESEARELAASIAFGIELV